MDTGTLSNIANGKTSVSTIWIDSKTKSNSRSRGGKKSGMPLAFDFHALGKVTLFPKQITARSWQ